jgi:hypothetical protein
MVMFRDQNAGQSHRIENDTSFFESVEQLQYLGTNLTNQNSVQEEIKGRLKSVHACYYSVQNLLSSNLLSKYIYIYIYIYIRRTELQCCVWV